MRSTDGFPPRRASESVVALEDEPAGQECLIVCIISDPDTGKGYWCEDCPEAGKGRS